MLISFTNTNDIHQGIDKVALRVYDDDNKKYLAPVAWNGVTAINEAPSGAENTKLYADNKVFGSLTSKEEFGLTLECYCTPTAFDKCDGTDADTSKTSFKIGMQNRKKFALIYREFVDDGNRDINDLTKGIYHIVIGCKAAPTSKDHGTVNDSPEATTLSYEISTTPEKVLFVEAATGVTEVSFDEVVHLVVEDPSDDALSVLFDDATEWTTSDGKLDFTDLYDNVD